MKKRTSLLINIFLISLLFLLINFKIEYVKKTSLNNIILNDKWKIAFKDKSYKSILNDEWKDVVYKKQVTFNKKGQNRFLWYKTNFYLPKEFAKKDLMIYLGNITNGHELYINGVKIGQKQFYPNNDFNEWNQKYCYNLPKNILKFDKNNIVCIKTYSSYEYGSNIYPEIGEYNNILNKYKKANNNSITIYIIVIIWLFFTSMYFLMMYYTVNKNKKNLFFSMLCLMISIYYSNFIVNKLPISYLSFQKIILIVLFIITIFIIKFAEYFSNFKMGKKYFFALEIAFFISSVIILSCTSLLQIYIYKILFFNVFLLILLCSIHKVLKSLSNKYYKNVNFIFHISFLCIVYDVYNVYTLDESLFGFKLNIVAVSMFLLCIAWDLVKEYNNVYLNAFTDGLTGLNNYIYLKNSFEDMTKDNMECYSIIMFDIDDFKKVNDNYGHVTGDFILKKVAEIIKEKSPQNSVKVRYGGEEFVIFLRNFNKPESINVGKSILQSIEGRDFYTKDNKERYVTINITLSAGITTINSSYHCYDMKNIVKRADRALYHSKVSGKNRVSHYDNLI